MIALKYGKLNSWFQIVGRILGRLVELISEIFIWSFEAFLTRYNAALQKSHTAHIERSIKTRVRKNIWFSQEQKF